MPHDFQTFLFHNSAESNIAIRKTSDFLKASYLTHSRLALDMLYCIDRAGAPAAMNKLT